MRQCPEEDGSTKNAFQYSYNLREVKERGGVVPGFTSSFIISSAQRMSCFTSFPWSYRQIDSLHKCLLVLA